ncbi:MAG: YidC/Oxa1 family insertase periplasmic-domain containing protein, partial [Muribaculaceae bacterium]|nr:YidC/Oxa1 family insertase periplasmic-domain containing protein [Muribaculaceae bacterium]
MDKNTVYGLVLMALVFFGFMYFTSPDPAAVEEQAQTEQAAADKTPTAAALFSDTEREWLAKNILSNGTPVATENGASAVALQSGDVDLTLVGDSIYGTVAVNGKKLQWSDIAANNLSAMSAAEHTAAIDKVRALSNSIGRYGRFASFLTGADKPVTLENEVIKLDLSSKGGMVARAELKKYDTEYDPDESKKVKKKVVMFDSESNQMSFTLPLPQEIATSDLYFTPREVTDSTVLMALDMSADAFWGIRYTLPKGDSYMLKMEVVQKNMAPIV